MGRLLAGEPRKYLGLSVVRQDDGGSLGGLEESVDPERLDKGHEAASTATSGVTARSIAAIAVSYVSS